MQAQSVCWLADTAEVVMLKVFHLFSQQKKKTLIISTFQHQLPLLPYQELKT